MKRSEIGKIDKSSTRVAAARPNLAVRQMVVQTLELCR